MSKQQDFIEWLAPVAKAQTDCYNLPASVLIAQGIIESGWGEYKKGNYNIFGRKWKGKGDYIESFTTEFINGERRQVTAKFKKYKDLYEACDDWCINIVYAKPYIQVWEGWSNKRDLNKFIEDLAKVYATDPEYANKIKEKISKYELYKYDGYTKGV